MHIYLGRILSGSKADISNLVPLDSFIKISLKWTSADLLLYVTASHREKQQNNQKKQIIIVIANWVAGK